MKTIKIHNATLILNDCIKELDRIKKAHVVITDPPYGVDFKGKSSEGGKRHREIYYKDTVEYYRSETLPRIYAVLKAARNSAVFCGTRRLVEYPQSDDLGGVICPSGVGLGSWGFNCYHPVLFYGNSFDTNNIHTVMVTIGSVYKEGEGENDHPCPKPIDFMRWAVSIASQPGQTVCDPFMGSGTTGVACAALGRKFIGVEIDEHYFDIAVQRIRDTHVALGNVQRGESQRKGFIY